MQSGSHKVYSSDERHLYSDGLVSFLQIASALRPFGRGGAYLRKKGAN